MRKKLALRFLQGVRRAVLPALFLVAVRPLMAQTGYVVEDLGVLAGDASSVAWAINANGDVVGWSAGPAGTRAFLYTNAEGMVALPGLPGRPRTVARDINDAGVIVGSANMGGTDLGHAVVWSDGSIQDLGTIGTGLYSEAWGVNNLGQVVGWSHTNGGSGLQGTHAFRFSPTEGMVDLTPESDAGSALDINDAGQVTGYKTALGGYHAFRWQAGAFEDLGVLPGFAHSFGWAINASGQVVGSSTSASGNSERLVRFTDGSVQSLGGTGEHNVAMGLNALGQVVGTRGQSQARALLYTDAGGLQELNSLVDASLGWLLLAANDINDAGQIVGRAFNNFTGQTHAVRLQPAGTAPPECTVRCLRSTGIALGESSLARGKYTIRGQVKVRDENGAAIPGALVVGRWTHPDGSDEVQNVSTASRGVALFTTRGRRGRYVLTIVNIVRSQYTFNPSQSVTSQSIVVPEAR